MGTIVKRGAKPLHQCAPPVRGDGYHASEPHGTVWRCECGRRFVSRRLSSTDRPDNVQWHQTFWSDLGLRRRHGAA